MRLIDWLRSLFRPPPIPAVSPPTPSAGDTSGKPMNSVEHIIRAAAAKYGVDGDTMVAIATIESGLDPNAKNPHSSAGGLFQFIDSTAAAYGLADRYDPVQAADAGARLARDNAATLAAKLGRPALPGELYLAHQQGAGGAIKLLKQPSRLAIEAVGEKAVNLNGGKPDWTCKQFASLWTTKLDKVLAKIKGD